jgi:hypothetical protein
VNIAAGEVYMGDQTRGPEEYLPLTPAMLDIVVALADDELHGYAIMREVRRRTDGRKRLAPGTLYRSLRQMQERGLVAESDERPEAGLDDERLEGLVHAARSKGLVPSARPSGATAGA